jgi:hypothetical protein
MAGRSRHPIVPPHPTPDAMVALANHHQFAPGARLACTRVESRMLLWCKAGSGAVTVNNQRHVLAPGALFVLPWAHRIVYEADARAPAFVGGVHIIPCQPRGGPVVYAVLHAPGPELPAYARRRYVSCRR